MAADIEAIAFVFIGAADAADHSWVGLEHHALVSVTSQLIGARQAGGAATGDDGLVGSNDRFGVEDRRHASSGGGFELARTVGGLGYSIPTAAPRPEARLRSKPVGKPGWSDVRYLYRPPARSSSGIKRLRGQRGSLCNDRVGLDPS